MKVEVLETTLVTPSEATPRHALRLSNLDLAVPKTHTPLVYYYPKPPAGPDAGAEGGSPFFEPARLRDALARALVPFYPLAGRLAAGPGGRIEIDCTGEGALFAVARADFAGDEVFRDFEPSPEARRLLVPFAESGEPPCVLAMVQDDWVVCRVFHKNTGIKKASVPTPSLYDMAMTSGGMEQSSITMPMPMQFPIPPAFTMDPVASYYSTAGASSSSVPPLMPPMAGMGSAGLQMNDTLFGDPMAHLPPMSFYHQMGVGALGAASFMATPPSLPMVSQKDVGLNNPDHVNTVELSSTVSTAPESMATMDDVDGLWKQVLKK